MSSTYTWSLQSGTLPPGLNLSGETDLDEVLTGSPTTTGTYNFTIRVTNNASSAFDDQAYSITITEVELSITPDLGLTIADMFDPNINKKLVTITDRVATSFALVSENLNQPLRKLRINADLGTGNKTYEVPASLLNGLTVRNRVYLYRLNSDINVIKAIYVI